MQTETSKRSKTVRGKVNGTLQEKAEFYRQIFDLSPFGIGIATLNGRVVTCNRTMQNITGYTAAELSEIKLSDTYEKKEDRKALFEIINRNGYAIDFPVRLKHKNGTPYDALLNVSKIRLGDKEFFQTICQEITERKRAEEGLKKRAEELTALQAMILDITSQHSLPELLHLIVERVAILLHASSGGLYLADPQKRQMRCMVSYNTARDFTGTVLAYGEGAAGLVAQTGKPLIIDDYRYWPGRAKVYEDEQPFRVLISAPLLWLGKVTGVIDVLREDVSKKFTQEDLQLLIMFANHAAVAVENMRLTEAVRSEISVRKNAERATRLQAERYANMIATTTDGYWLVDSQGKFLDVNDSYCRMSGYTRKELLKLSIPDMEAAEQPEETAKHIKNIIKTGFDRFETRHKAKDGRIFNVEISVSFWQATKQLIVFIRDITERKQIENSLKESEKRYRGLFEDSPVSLWEENFFAVKRRLDALRAQGVTDMRAYLESHPQEVADCAALAKVIDVNKASLELFKAKKKDDLLGNLSKILSPQYLEDFRKELVNIAEGKTKFNWESVDQTLTGEHIDVSLSWSVLPGHEGDLSKTVLSITDITDRKLAEKEMRRLINDLHKLSEKEKKDRIFAEALAKNVISIKSTLNTDEILDSILNTINNVVPADAISIMRIEGEHARIVRARGYQERGLTDWVKRRQFKLDEIKTLREIVRSKKFKITSNTDKSQDWTVIAETAWIKSNIISPIIENNTVIGFVNVDSTTPDFYTEEHAQHLEVFTDQVSTALKNAHQFEATQRRMNRMQAMTQIDQAINSSLDLNVSMEIVLSNAKDQLSADAVDILLVDDVTNSLVFSKAKGFKTDEIRKSNLRLGNGLPGRAVLERTTVAIPDLNSVAESYFKNLLVEREGFVSYFCVPLITKGQLKGVMEVYFRHTFQADQEWLEFLEMLTQQTAIAINNAELLNSLQSSNIQLLNAYETTLKGWVDALDMRDHETEGHTQRVTELSLKLANLMGIKDKEIVNFQRGALLHDIGKVAVPDTILNKPGPLTDEEWVIMRRHPQFAFQLLSKSKYLIPALDIPYCHHEKWNGSGYPRGLKGEAIPLAARIFAIVDVWDALTSERPYRKAWTQKKAMHYIQEQSGKHFDPEIVTAFQAMIKKDLN